MRISERPPVVYVLWIWPDVLISGGSPSGGRPHLKSYRPDPFAYEITTQGPRQGARPLAPGLK
jgi:hypothetical protein